MLLRDMPRVRKGDLSAKMAIMGLLVERPDTINGVKARLGEKFSEAKWSPTVAYGSVAALADDGYLRIAAGGGERSLDLYEATEKGEVWFRRWLGEFSPPVVRDTLRAKLRYVDDENELLAIIAAIREQEEAAFQSSEGATMSLNKARRRGEFGTPQGEDWEGRLRYALLSDEVLLWQNWGERLKRLRENLEGPQEQLEGASNGATDDG
jgi:DNA-binding PadR family transcriptional regulator